MQNSIQQRGKEGEDLTMSPLKVTIRVDSDFSENGKKLNFYSKVTARVDSDFSENGKKFELTLTSIEMGRSKVTVRVDSDLFENGKKMSDQHCL
ncbi:hypothetical protein Lal_00005822 [Lupinus albus]|nr:hypothetical protein Lal_00005822 [Lupinus albus]